MARNTRSKSKNKGGSKRKGPKVAITRSADERNTGSKFFSLQDDEKFEGYALFNPDPAAEDNPGYVEFKQHYDTQRGSYVPCWGAKNGCIFCKAGMNPSQRALAAFLVTKIDGEELDEPEVKIFRMNWTMIEEWADTLDEDGETLGQKVRIKCVDHGDGTYTTKFYDTKRLAKKELKAAIEEIPDLEESIQRQLDRALENLRVQDVLEDEDDEDDDDDDDEEETLKKDKKKEKKKPSKKDEDEDDDDDDDDDDEDEDEDEDNEEEEDDEDDEESDDDDEEESDDDDDEDEDEDEEEAEEDAEDDEEEDADVTLDGEFTIVSTSESEMTFTFKELDSDVYVGQNIADDVDFDDFKKGDKVEVKAEQDADGDWVATELTKVEKAKGSSKKKTSSKKKGGSKKKK